MWVIRIYDYDMALLKVVDECVHVVEIDAATLVIAALEEERRMR